MKRAHEKYENHQKFNFCNFQKCDLRTGLRPSTESRGGPEAPLGVKSAIFMEFSGKQLNSLKIAKFLNFRVTSLPLAPLPQNRTMHMVFIGF